MIKLSTINQIVEAILAEGEAEFEIDIEPTIDSDNPDAPDKDFFMKRWKTIANEAVIYFKMAMICEDKGIDEAMKYYLGNHSKNEYQEFQTSAIKRGKV